MQTTIQILSLLCLSAALSPAAGVQGQVEIGPSGMKDAILITKISVAGNEVNCKQHGPVGGPVVMPVTPFEATEDWPRFMEIHLLNRTDKTIVALYLYRRRGQSGVFLRAGPNPN